MKRVALIGYGYWGPNLLRNLFDTKNCKVVYCCDLSRELLKKAKKRYPSIIITTDLDRIINDPKIDGIVIATSTKFHFPIAKKALLAGKDVLIEKPMTMNVAEAKTLVDLAKRKKRILMVDHTFLFNPAVLKIKELIDKNKLGKILYIDSVRINLGLFRPDVNVVFDLATHDFSIINFLLGSKPKAIKATGKTHFNKNEAVAYITADYPKNIMAHIHISWLSPLKIKQMLIIGSKRMVVYNDDEVAGKIRVYDKGVLMKQPDGLMKEQAIINYRSGDVWLPKLDIIESLSLLIDTFIKAITDRQNPKSNGDFALEIMEILEASNKSIRIGRKVSL